MSNVSEQGRLLTKAELLDINNAQPPESKYGDVFEAIARAQDAKNMDKDKAEGRREVIQWFLKHESGGVIKYADGLRARFDPPWEEWQELLKELKPQETP